MSVNLLKRLEIPKSRFLVYTSAGNHSQVHRWLKGRKDFDLWITCYTGENHTLREWADYYNEREGGKFPNLQFVIQNWSELIQQYEAILVVDDDFHLSATSITELFTIRECYDLYVLQPALSQLGKVSHWITKARQFSYLRFTNFVEVNCPLFRTDRLLEFMEVYDPLLICHGVDYWYMQLLVGDQPDKAAIVDVVVATNPHDSTKGGREIMRLQSDEQRLANWNLIKASRGLVNIYPFRDWCTVRRLDSLWFYVSTSRTFVTNLVARIRRLF